MGIGKTVLRFRQERAITQSELGRQADLAPSYISRIENGRVQPSTATLGRIAAALKITLADLLTLAPGGGVPSPGRCPISSSGTCIGVQLRSNRGRRPKNEKWAYGEEELHLLRITDQLAHHGAGEIRTALRVFLEALLERARKTR